MLYHPKLEWRRQAHEDARESSEEQADTLIRFMVIDLRTVQQPHVHARTHITGHNTLLDILNVNWVSLSTIPGDKQHLRSQLVGLIWNPPLKDGMGLVLLLAFTYKGAL